MKYVLFVVCTQRRVWKIKWGHGVEEFESYSVVFIFWKQWEAGIFCWKE